ncbi:S-adenosyl-L-methionine-dependent methyltransferase [Synechococcus sp. MVIR-18-1]|nr:S-adenosyl-L-methionine-dependent methyltransferase [Synechococcus sp. MVIR-18-1]
MPSTYPFQLELNRSLCRLEQSVNKELESLLEKAYLVGNEMGTPSDDTNLGRPYVDDFISFVSKFSSHSGSLLEIGAGTGFLSKRLSEEGWTVTSIEPGTGYQPQWISNDVDVINDFFPSAEISGQFDVIVFYTVLEHIKDTKSFLTDVKNYLKPNGYIFLAVPDCTLEISNCDASILLHEHFHYFTKHSLLNTLIESGLTGKVYPSEYGRCLYAVAQISLEVQIPQVSNIHLVEYSDYISGILKAQSKLSSMFNNWLNKGQLGIFCPSRLLNLMSPDNDFLFYDDSPALHGKFYPPFSSQVRSRADLFIDKPDKILIASRTFGSKIKTDLLNSGLNSDIILISDLL